MRRVGLVALVLAACVDAPPPPSSTVATVGDRVITLEALAGVQAAVNREVGRSKSVSPDEVPSLLDTIVEVELLSNEARRRGVDSTKAARVKMRRAMAEAYIEDVLAKLPHGVTEGARARGRLEARAHRTLVDRLLADPTLDGDAFTRFGAPLSDPGEERIAREAERLGYATHLLTSSRVNRMLAGLLVRSEVEAGKIVVPKVSEADVRAAYDSDPERFHRPAAAHAWVARLDDARRAAQLAHELREIDPSDRAGHEDLLLDYGVAPGLVRDVLVDDDRVPRTIAKAIHELPSPGAIGVPLVADGAFFVVRLLGRRSAKTVEFEEAREQLGAELSRVAKDAATRALVEGLHGRWPVHIDEEVLQGYIDAQRRALERGAPS